MKDIKSIKEIEDLKGKKVLLRLDLNVPILAGRVENDFRIRKSLPTIEYLVKNEAKVIIITHIFLQESKSLRPVFEAFKKSLNISFNEEIIGPKTDEAVRNMKNGEVLLLENLRLNKGEKENDINFANELSKLADIYVNDAFASSHREHASIIGLPKLLPAYSGLLFEEEVKNLSEILDPPRPFLFILGGAKFDTKIPLIIKYLEKADFVYAAGALANDFFKAKGYEVGISKVSGKDFGLEKYLDHKALVLPKDVTVRNGDDVSVKRPDEVGKNDQILDVGVEAIPQLKEFIAKSKFILWNGPLGEYEKGFRDGTLDLARAIIDSSARSVVGGGDTFAVLSKLHFEEEFDFVSTAGGALLQFLYDGTLPGIEALKS